MTMLANVPSCCLWDTGAMVSVVSKKWLGRNFPGTNIRNIEELLDEPLRIKTANKTVLEYSGWVELMFKLESDTEELAVPFLVVDSDIDTVVDEEEESC